ncbi:hypothetical protein FGO68_gene15450 [Halteria grandinella]|uniref:Uncharacterized protein n=1 Tax=Halteria grandinella TaxID=5974 RepID=A0A8J8NX72_HALGN|nr:hypothetical protein FGO68_gene15450 [Halteria grandinella]
MLNPKVIANISLILEDTYKQLKRIQIERQRESEREDEEEKDRQIQKEVQELTAFEKLQEPLLEEENSLGGAALSSHQYQKTIQTKLKIYKNTLDIISQAIVQIKFSTTFVNISSQAQVMIEAYKDNLSHEAILLQKMSQRSSNSSKEHGYDYDSEKDEEYDDENESKSVGSKKRQDQENETTFTIRTLNMNDLQKNVVITNKQIQQYNEFQRGGDILSMQLLLFQAMLFSFNHFSLVPLMFEASLVVGQPVLYTGLLLAMTPFATSLHAAFQHLSPWNISFKNQMIFGLAMMILGNALFIYAVQLQSFSIMMISRFIFGFGGSKVVHRRYVANFVDSKYWNKYYDSLVTYSFLGMVFGPSIPIICSVLDVDHLQKVGYMCLYTSVPYLIVFAWLFRATRNVSQRVQKREEQLFDDNSMSSEDNLIQNEHYKRTLKQIIDQNKQSGRSSFLKKYGPFVLIIVARVVEKISHEELLATYTLTIAYTQQSNIPLIGANFIIQCAGYSIMGILVISIHFIMSKASLSSRSVSLLIFSYSVSIVGGLLQADYFNINRILVYHLGFALSFLSTEMQEVAITTLTAHVAPSNLYQSKFSPSFALTFIGTFGRALGCASITLASLNCPGQDYKQIVDVSQAPLVVAFGILLVLLSIYYSHLTKGHQHKPLDMYLNKN